MSTATIDYDALAAQHGGTAQIDYDALAAQHGGTVAGGGSPPTADSRNGVQRFVDNLTTVTPQQEQGHSWLTNKAQEFGAGAIQGFTSPFVHPVQTLEGLGNTIAHPINSAETLAKSVIASPAQAAGNIVGGAVLGDAGPASLKLAGSVLPEGVTSAVSSAGKALGSRILPAMVDGTPESMLTRAIKPAKNNVGWNQDIQTAAPLMKSAEQTLGKPIAGVDDALEAAIAAKKQIWQQYQRKLGPAQQMGATIDGNQIADAMMNSIDKRTAVQNPGLVEKVKAIADTYRKPLALNDAEDFLQSTNKDLNSYYAKNKVGQQVAQNDPEISSTVAEAGALRDALYSKLDQVAGPGAAQLKQAYGAVSNVQKELYGRQLVAARQNPESLSEQLSTASAVGNIAKSTVNLDVGDAIEGSAKMLAAKLLKDRNTSDALIERAFKAAQPAAPFPMPGSPQIAGLLPRGAIQMPAPEAGGSPLASPPPVDATTRAQRLGLLLTPQAGGRVPLPYSPGMSSGEQVVALQHLMRNQRAPLALPARAQPFITPPPS